MIFLAEFEHYFLFTTVYNFTLKKPNFYVFLYARYLFFMNTKMND